MVVAQFTELSLLTPVDLGLNTAITSFFENLFTVNCTYVGIKDKNKEKSSFSGPFKKIGFVLRI